MSIISKMSLSCWEHATEKIPKIFVFNITDLRHVESRLRTREARDNNTSLWSESKYSVDTVGLATSFQHCQGPPNSDYTKELRVGVLQLCNQQASQILYETNYSLAHLTEMHYWIADVRQQWNHMLTSWTRVSVDGSPWGHWTWIPMTDSWYFPEKSELASVGRLAWERRYIDRKRFWCHGFHCYQW
jgi:hypothetical protein